MLKPVFFDKIETTLKDLLYIDGTAPYIVPKVIYGDIRHMIYPFNHKDIPIMIGEDFASDPDLTGGELLFGYSLDFLEEFRNSDITAVVNLNIPDENIMGWFQSIEISNLDNTAIQIIVPPEDSFRGNYISFWFFTYEFFLDRIKKEPDFVSGSSGYFIDLDPITAPHIVEQLGDNGLLINKSKMNGWTSDEDQYRGESIIILLKVSVKQIWTDIDNPQTPFLFKIF